MADAQALLGWLGRFFDDVQVILYLRRQEDWLLSRYSQALRRGVTLKLSDYIRRNSRQNFHAIASLWADAAGAAKTHVRLLEPGAMVDNDLIADFSSVIGVDTEGLKEPVRRNESFSVAGAEFLRRLNERMTSPHGNGDIRDNPLMERVPAKLTKWSEGGEKLRLSGEMIDLVRDANAGTNEQLRATFFPDRAEMFPARPRSDAPEQQASAEEIADIGINLYALARMERLKPVPAKPGLIRRAGRPAEAAKRRKPGKAGRRRRKGHETAERG